MFSMAEVYYFTSTVRLSINIFRNRTKFCMRMSPSSCAAWLQIFCGIVRLKAYIHIFWIGEYRYQTLYRCHMAHLHI